MIKLSSNETPFGPSPRAVEAYLARGASLSRYPDGSARPLREAIAELYGLDPARIVCGAGSDELLNLLAAAYLGPGDEAIYSRARLSRLPHRHSAPRARLPWSRRRRRSPPMSTPSSPA